MAFTKLTKNVLNVSSLPDRVQNQAQALKATFDQAGVDIKEALNTLIAELEAKTSASNLGADVSSVTTKTVQAILTAFEIEIANRYTKNEIDALVSGNTNNLVADVDINLSNGVITVTKKDGTKETYDTAIEKVPAKFEIVESGTSLFLKITNVDGTSTQTDITELMNIYDFNNSNEIAFNVSGTGNEKVVTASIRPNSIGLDKLSLSAVSTLEGYMISARDSANAAKTSETNARNSANTATKAAEKASIAEGLAETAISKATEAESYAHGGTGTREGEDTDNAKYYSQIAKEVAGGDFVTQTEMEAYAQKKGSVPSFEGEELSGEAIETDVPLEMESNLHISGNSEQNSRSGKNLLKNAMSTTTKSGVTFTKNSDGSITINGTATADGNHTIYSGNNTGLKTGSYVLSGIESGGNMTSGDPNARYMQVYIDDVNMGVAGTNSSYRTFTLTTIPTKIRVALFFRVGAVFENFMIYPQIEEGSTPTDYEPYGAMPSPDYPSEIRSVKSKSDNWFNKDNEPSYIGGLTGLTTENVQPLDSGIRITAPIDVTTSNTASLVYAIKNLSNDVGKTIRMKANVTSTGGLKPRYAIGLCNADGSNRKIISYTSTSGAEITATVPTLTGEQTYLGVWLYLSASGTGVAGDYAEYTDIMVTIDKEIKEYQPYYVPVEARVEGNNLVNNKLQSQTKSGVTVTVNEDKSITLNGTCTATSTVFIRVGEDIVLPAGTYTLANYNKNATGSTFLFYDDNNNFSLKNIVTKTFETEVTITPMIRIGAGATINNETISPAILRGTYASNSALPNYEAGKEIKTISLPLGDIELRSTPDGTRDTFTRVDGVWNKVEKIYRYTVKGNEPAYIQSTSTSEQNGTRYDFNATSNTNIPRKTTCFSNYYKYKGVNAGGIWVDTSSTSYMKFRIQTFDFETVDEIKTWLQTKYSEGKPLYIDYVLATPTYTPITDTALIQALDELESLILHKGYNRITATCINGVKAYLDLDIPSTASVTNVVETETSMDMIVPVVSCEGDVKVKIPKENKMTLNPSTGEVKVKGKKLATEAYVNTAVAGKADTSYVDDAIASAGIEIVEDTYVGDGTKTERVITLGFQPRLLHVWAMSELEAHTSTMYTQATPSFMGTNCKNNDGYTEYDDQYSKIQITTTGFKIVAGTDSDDYGDSGFIHGMNAKGVNYRYIAMK